MQLPPGHMDQLLLVAGYLPLIHLGGAVADDGRRPPGRFVGRIGTPARVDLFGLRAASFDSAMPK
jgi:hypothetical protein